MNTKTMLLISVILILLLPLSVTLVTWRGLDRMDHEIDLVIEEYAETRNLQPIDINLSVALLVLQQDDPKLAALALTQLLSAESTMLQFLAEQYDSAASDEHQAEESMHASNALTQLSELVGTGWPTLTTDQRIEQVQNIRSDIRDLYNDAESGIQATPILAKEAQRSTLWTVFFVSITAVVMCLLLSLWPMRGLIHRLRKLRKNLESQTQVPITANPKDVEGELNQLEELNERMLIKIQESNRELLRRERMAGIGLLAADVAHEINNPLNAMLGLSELSLQTTGRGPINKQGQQELHESLTVIRREVLRCRGIVERLMAMVRGNSKPQHFDVTRLLVETVDVARAARPDKSACFHIVGAERSLQIFAPPQEVRQIILTLLINAADAITDDGRIEVDATRADGEVWLRVRDNGRGFTPQMQEGFFVPFNTNRADVGGTGLGLSIANTLSTDIGAEIRSFSDGADQGSMFLLAIQIDKGHQ